MRLIVALFVFITSAAWGSPGEDWLAIRYGDRAVSLTTFSTAYGMSLRRFVADEDFTPLTLALPMYTDILPAMERYYTKTKDYAKDPGYLQEQLIWDYLLRSPKAGPILRKLIDSGAVRPPEPLPAVPN